jgi:hypothetical protein
MAENKGLNQCSCMVSKYKEYFRIGISKDFIEIRNDFPMSEISPSDFSRLCRDMFRRNDEVCNAE